MLINAQEEEESRVAIVEDGQLIDYNYEICSREQSRGNIFKGVVTKVEPSLQAAFVDYGAERAGFLPVGEVRSAAWSGQPKDARNPKIEEILKKKQEIMVQVVKEGIGTKGAALSTRIAIPGRYLVIMPGESSGGISRKIADDEQRRRAKEILHRLDVPDDMGIIIRTAGMDRTHSEIETDFLYLNKLWNTIMETYMRAKAPAMVYQESDVILRSVRDYFTPDVSEIVTDDDEAFQRILDFVTAVMPSYQNRIRLFDQDRPLFDFYRIEDQIDRLHEQRIRLKAGGEIVITQTEALVAIDVNSGRATGEKDAELTAFKTNCEAAEEIARQLRLRDLGGLIVIDFIDMRDGKHVREVERILRTALRKDKARIETTHISRLGLLEVSRQRMKKSVYTTSFSPCTACSGTGVVRSVETLALSVLRHIQARVALGDVAFVRGDLPPDVLVYLVNAKRDELVRLQSSYDVRIQLNLRPERQGLSGVVQSANPSDWLEFHRRLRQSPKPQAQLQVATVEAAVKATHEARREIEGRNREAAEEAKRRGEPERIVAAYAAGEDVDAMRRREIEEENRRVREHLKRRGLSPRDGVTKLPPVSVDETEAVDGLQLDATGNLIPVVVPAEKVPEPPRRGSEPRRAQTKPNTRRPDPRPVDDADAFRGFVLDASGELVAAPPPPPPPPASGRGAGPSGGGGGSGGGHTGGGHQGGSPAQAGVDHGGEGGRDDFRGDRQGRRRRRRRRRDRGGERGNERGGDRGGWDRPRNAEGGGGGGHGGGGHGGGGGGHSGGGGGGEAGGGGAFEGIPLPD